MSARAKPADPQHTDAGLRRAVAILPARLGSTRLARKMLLADTGLPLFVHTARNAASAGVFERVVVATDAAEIAEAARQAGLEAVITRADHPSGTDRVAEAYTALLARGLEAEVVVGVQGDEPDLEAEDLARLVAAFADDGVELATLAVRFEDERSAELPQAVKVVCDRHGDALYFSRARIPFRGHAREGGEQDLAVLRRHVGVYAFVPQALARFCSLPRGALEACENLEQLRWLEAGGKIRVVEATRAPLGIDTREDYDRFVARWRARGALKTTVARDAATQRERAHDG
jgi:3-deoxy-manno-octulosonate cytidylyltransferase (CMP-KDO synthetase)